MTETMAPDGNPRRYFLLLPLALLAVFATFVALHQRMVGIDQSYLLLLAQEIQLGRQQYTQLYDLQPPAGIYLHMLPLIAAKAFGLPIVFAWNAYMAIWCGASAYLLAVTFPTDSRVPVGLIWYSVTLLGFNDTFLGQREFFFCLAWFPYLAMRLSPPGNQRAGAEVAVGLLLSVIICMKPLFAVFVLLIDLPILFVRRKQQSLTPLIALIGGGVVQVAHFFATTSLAAYLQLFSRVRYYETVGADYPATLSFMLAGGISYVSGFILLAIVLLCRALLRPYAYALGCAATAALAFGLAVWQGQPRDYTFIPIAIAPIAAALHALFGAPTASAGMLQPSKARALAACLILCLLLSASQMMRMEGGVVAALEKRYRLQQPDRARIGAIGEDDYMTWVRKNVKPSESIWVIALEYGHSSAFDPILSTLRLGRRVNSYAPVLQFPLRAAIVAKDPSLLEAAWNNVIDEIEKGKADWIVMRNTVPQPLVGPLIDIISRDPRFYPWLTRHFTRREGFGDYVVFRRATH